MQHFCTAVMVACRIDEREITSKANVARSYGQEAFVNLKGYLVNELYDKNFPTQAYAQFRTLFLSFYVPSTNGMTVRMP